MSQNDFKIKILAYDYEVVSVDPSNLFDGSRVLFTNTDHVNSTIEVAFDNNLQQLQSHLMEEVMLITLEQLGYLDLAEDEKFIRSFGTSMAQVLKDNPEFLKLYWQDDKDEIKLNAKVDLDEIGSRVEKYFKFDDEGLTIGHDNESPFRPVSIPDFKGVDTND